MLTRTLLLVTLALLLAYPAHADGYDVQIGAFRNPASATIELPAAVGELRSVRGADGLTRFVVGPYASRAEAEQARATLRDAGFGGAFIRSSDSDAARWDERPATYTRNDIGEGHQAETVAADTAYTDSGEGEVVRLDGKLHRKVGNTFIPLKD